MTRRPLPVHTNSDIFLLVVVAISRHLQADPSISKCLFYLFGENKSKKAEISENK